MLKSVKIRIKPIQVSVIALVLAASWAPLTLWSQQNEAKLLKQARVTKHQAKRIALARVKHGTIKCAELEKENGILIWSVDVAQSGKKGIWSQPLNGTANVSPS